MFKCDNYIQQDTRRSIGLLIFRLAMGSAMMLHGFPKIQNAFGWMGDAPIPGILQALAALSEFGGGIAVILGLLTPLACLGILSTMFVAMFMVHIPAGDPFVSQTGGKSYELALIYFSGAVMLLLNGPGRFSIDNILFAKCRGGNMNRQMQTQ